MARLTLLGLLIAAAFASSGCFLNGQLVTQQIATDAARRRERALQPLTTLTPTPPVSTPSATPTQTPSPGRVLATVRRVLDGNTILLEGGNVARYIGVDTPGAGMFRRPVEPFGREAAQRNVDLVEGKLVELEGDVTDVDANGQLLRYVYVDGVMVNRVLLGEGLARLAPVGRNSKYTAALQASAADAQRRMVNIWTIITSTPTDTRLPTVTLLPTDTPRPTPTSAPVPDGVRLVPAILSSPTPTAPPATPTSPAIATRPPAATGLPGLAATPAVVLLTNTPTPTPTRTLVPAGR
jgi:micrococcal nuclease